MTRWSRFLPAWQWLRGYRRADLGPDAAAGVTVAVMLIPQGMAYALLAGLPPVVGLYASVAPVVLYALLGTSRQLAVGPVAMVSLLVATALSPLAEAGTAQYVALAGLLALMVGGLQVGMGLARMGFVVNFLAHPVIVGFTAAAALIIAAGQLKHLLRLPLPRDHRLHVVVAEVAGRLGDTHLETALLGVGAVALLLLCRRFAPRWPAALLVVGLGTGLVALLDLDAAGVVTVGEVPAGLASPRLPPLDAAAAGDLLFAALTIALIGFLESVSVARYFAEKHRYAIDPNQELIGLGAANLGAGLFGAFPVAGGFARSAVNAQAGARTGLAALITAALVALTLVALTPLVRDLPAAALAAIILVAVAGLIDWREAAHLWKVKRGDFALMAVTFAGTLALGIEEGILLGVGASLALFVLRTTRPHYAVLGRLPGTDTFRNRRHFPHAVTVPGLLVLRFDAAFYFGNTRFLRERLAAEERAAPAPLHGVVLDASGINALDASAAQTLRFVAEDYAAREVAFCLAAVKGPVREVLRRSGMWDLIGDGRIFLTVADAVDDFGTRSDDETANPQPGGDDP